MDLGRAQAQNRITGCVTIASGGCNVLNYSCCCASAKIMALDLNPHHVALTKLKLAALEHLPDHESFFRWLGEAADSANVAAYDIHLKDRLDGETRSYWQRWRPPAHRNVRAQPLPAWAFGLLHRPAACGVARLHGKRLENILDAKTPDEQRQLFESLGRAAVCPKARPSNYFLNRLCRFTRWAFRRRNMTR